MANDFRDALDTRVGQVIHRYAYLYSTKEILPGQEVITYYGKDFDLTNDVRIPERILENFLFFRNLRNQQETWHDAREHEVIDLSMEE